MATFSDIKEMLQILREDSATPRSLREKIGAMTQLIDSNKDAQIKISSLQETLEEVANDINLPPYIRTQVWSISGALETVDG